ncbi:MAG: Ig-like domain-containing protein [Gemmatimonadota bacterium]|nr:Ig-like domain-containing protein [Gemmatimonadota bacterium]
MRKVLVLTFAAVLSACGGGDGGTPPVTVASVTVNGASTVTVGSVIQLTGTANGSNGTALQRTFSWSSDNNAVATVNSVGGVSGVGVGTANIKATTDGKEGLKPVTVTLEPVASVAVSAPATTIGIGASVVFSAQARDASGNVLTGRTINWSSSDVSKATVSPATGATTNVTGVGAGTANIIATVEGVTGQLQATIVSGTPITISGVTPAVLQVGSSATITGTNFATAAAGNAVTVDGKAATVTSASATQLTITVPDLGCVPAARKTVAVSTAGFSAQRTNVPVAPNATPLTLSVGQVKVVANPAQLACIQLAAGTTVRDYVFVAANASGLDDTGSGQPPVVENYSIQTTVGDLAPLGGFGFNRVAGSSAANRTQAPVSPNEAHHALIRAEGQRLVVAAKRSGNSGALRTMMHPNIVGTPTMPRLAYTVGQVLPIRVPGASNLCNNFTTVNAVVKAVGTHGVLLEDPGVPPNGFTAADYASLSTEFDSKIYPTDIAHFGPETDINGDGQVFILVTPKVNDLSPAGSNGFVGGYFWIGDFFPHTATAALPACAQSNLAEIFYMLAPDPTAAHGNTFSVAFVRRITRGTIAHEFQHMINSGYRLPSPTVFTEATWLDEAMAHFAEDLVGRAEKGFTDMQTMTYADISSNFDDYNAFFFQNMFRFRSFLQTPEAVGPNSERAGPSLAFRGAAWSILRYTADQYSVGGDVAEFTRRMVHGPDTSVANLSGNAGVPFDSIVVGWMLANYADHDPIPGLGAKYSYKSYDMRSAQKGVAGDLSSTDHNYPLPVINFSSAMVPIAAAYRSGSGQYFRLDGTSGTSPSWSFSLLNQLASGPIVGLNGRVYVMRVQ